MTDGALGTAIAGALGGYQQSVERAAQARRSRESQALEMYTTLLKEGWRPVDIKRGSREGEVLQIAPLGVFLEPPKIDKSKEYALRLKRLETEERIANMRLAIAKAQQEGLISKSEAAEKLRGLDLKIKQLQLAQEEARTERARTGGAGRVFFNRIPLGGAKERVVGQDTYGNVVYDEVVDTTKPPSPTERRMAVRQLAEDEIQIELNKNLEAVKPLIQSVNNRLPPDARYGWAWLDAGWLPDILPFGEHSGAVKVELPPEVGTMATVRQMAKENGISVEEQLELIYVRTQEEK